jgi:hypothetical protein
VLRSSQKFLRRVRGRAAPIRGASFAGLVISITRMRRTCPCARLAHEPRRRLPRHHHSLPSICQGTLGTANRTGSDFWTPCSVWYGRSHGLIGPNAAGSAARPDAHDPNAGPVRVAALALLRSVPARLRQVGEQYRCGWPPACTGANGAPQCSHRRSQAVLSARDRPDPTSDAGRAFRGAAIDLLAAKVGPPIAALGRVEMTWVGVAGMIPAVWWLGAVLRRSGHTAYDRRGGHGVARW